MRCTYLFYLCFFAIIFQACDYANSGDYFKDVEPPNPEKTFVVSLNPNSESLVIPKNKSIELRIDVNALGLSLDDTYGNKEYRGCRLMFGSQELSLYITKTSQANDYQLRAYIYSGSLPEGKEKLTLYLKTRNSGTGSLADKMGAEYYEAVKTWNIEIIDLAPNGKDMMPISNRVSKDGHLELFWEKPPIPENVLLGYQIKYYDQLTGNYERKMISGANNTSYVDTNYVCSNNRYTIYAIVRGYNDNLDDYWNDDIKYKGNIEIAEPLPEVKVKDNLNDSITISWTKGKYKASYSVYLDNDWNNPISCISDTSVNIKLKKNIIFTQQSGYLYIYSYNKENSDARRISVYFSFSRGIKFSDYNANIFGYSKQENSIFVVQDYKLTPIKLPDGTKGNNTYKTFYGMDPGLSIAPNSPQIVVLDQDFIIVFKNSNMEVERKISIGSSENYYNRYIKVTNNNFIFYAKSAQKKGSETFLLSIYKYELNTGNLAQSFELEANYPVYKDLIDVSQDGKYLALNNYMGKLLLYDISNNKLELVHEESVNSGVTISFHPLYPEILISLDNSNRGAINIIEVPAFKQKYSIQSEAGFHNFHFGNIDPVTGYLFVTDYSGNDSNNIVDVKTGKIIYQFSYNYSTIKLYGNILFSNDGRMYNLNK